ncbi:MAG: DUF2339 domain-containing protein [Bacteroidales bacterium]|nr:DUF2339 domain-containing protein [Bacteroidales bacterium]MBN2756953.1 DUF2339 domain-containing protein [Bacteroidales bacterium]
MTEFLIFLVFLVFIFIITIFIIILNLKSFLGVNFRSIKKQIDQLSNDLKNVKTIDSNVLYEEKISEIKVDDLIKEKIEEIEEKIVEETTEKENVYQYKSKENIEKISKQHKEQLSANQIYVKAKKIRQKTDIEKFIGENLINKIGIVVLVLSLFFFVQYAIGKGWINDAGRVAIGIFSGGVLIGIAHYLRKTYTAFSSVLAGGGIAVLYSTIALGFQLYLLFNQVQAFSLMVVITVFAILLSLVYDRKELAVLAILGGFATPLSLSTGEGNYIVLFSYILILDIGMIVLAYFKKWNIVNIISFVLTVILFMIWMISSNIDMKLPFKGALIFATAFYLVFFIMNIINNLKENRKFSVLDFLMVIFNTFLYYAAGMFLFDKFNDDFMGIFTVILGVFNFGFAFPLYKRKQIDKNLVFLLIGLVLTFVSLTAPVQLNGNYITMFWAVESVLLLWLSQQSGLKLLKIASFIVIFLMIISLIIDWNQVYINPPYEASVLTLFLNKGFITSIFTILSIVVNIRLLKNDDDISVFKNLSAESFKLILVVFLIVSLYISFLLEIAYQVSSYYEYQKLTNVAVSLYNYFYLTVIVIWASKKQIKYIFEGITIITFFSIFIYVFNVIPEYISVRDRYLLGEIQNNFSLLHFFNSFLVIVLCYFTWKNISIMLKEQKIFGNIAIWLSIIVGIIVLSVDIDNILLYISSNTESISEIERQSHLIAWPILWGVIAFVLMILGMKTNMKNLRIISLFIFFFTLLKLFAKDVWSMSEGGRIAAFISLGVLLLTVSFLYQKLRQLIFEDEKEEELENLN